MTNAILVRAARPVIKRVVATLMKRRLMFAEVRRGATNVEITAGIMPRFTSLNANFSPGGAMVMSQTAMRPMPPPKA